MVRLSSSFVLYLTIPNGYSFSSESYATESIVFTEKWESVDAVMSLTVAVGVLSRFVSKNCFGDVIFYLPKFDGLITTADYD